jgi:ribose/xylose/arabinose/galactoside ABC-type transport system permease subunit
VLITKLEIEAFIVTLGPMGIYPSLVTWLADGGTLSLDFSLRTLYRPVYYAVSLGSLGRSSSLPWSRSSVKLLCADQGLSRL